MDAVDDVIEAEERPTPKFREYGVEMCLRGHTGPFWGSLITPRKIRAADGNEARLNNRQTEEANDDKLVADGSLRLIATSTKESS